MNNKFPPPMRNTRRKLSVEVYFVLYLTAIILLLGTAPLSKERYDAELEEAIAKLINTDFGVEVEDIWLTIPFIPVGMKNDSNGINLTLDTVNVIRAHGSFSRVDFRIVSIEDTATGHTLPIEKASLVRNGDSSVLFFWKQGEAKQTAIYRISVEAEATPVIPSSVSSPSLRRRIESIVAKRNAMRDTAIFSVSVLPITSPEFLLAARRAPTLGGEIQGNDSFSLINAQMLPSFINFGNSFSISPLHQRLTSPPGKTWEQHLMVAGTDPRQLSLTLPSGVRVNARGNDFIKVGGVAPSKGEAEIRIKAKAPGPSQPIDIFFVVSTTSPSDPKGLPEMLYHGNTYAVDFNMSGVDDGRISVSITENGKTVAENRGASFNYSPAAKSGSVRFARYVDGNQVGEYTCKITEYPRPLIQRVQKHDDGSVTFETTTYGQVNGRPNIAVFRILTGPNAEEPEQEGTTTVDQATGRVVMRWRVRPKSSSKDLEFTVKAWDLRGPTYSQSYTYEQ